MAALYKGEHWYVELHQSQYEYELPDSTIRELQNLIDAVYGWACSLVAFINEVQRDSMDCCQ